jgi:hypothetical protein
MRPATRLAWGLLCATLALGGCQRLSVEQKVSLDGAEPKQLDVEAPRYEQTVTVEVDSPSVPVLAYVVKTEDVEAAYRALVKGQEPENALAATKEKSAKVSITATIPAKTAYSVLLRAVGGGGEATLRIKGQ